MLKEHQRLRPVSAETDKLGKMTNVWKAIKSSASKFLTLSASLSLVLTPTPPTHTHSHTAQIYYKYSIGFIYESNLTLI